MNLSIAIGLGGGFLIIAISIIMAGSPMAFIDIPSFLIVMGGAFASVTVSCSFEAVIEALKMCKTLLFSSKVKLKPLIDDFIKYAEVAKKNGRLALDKVEVEDKFVKKGVDSILGNKSPQVIEKIMQQERDALYSTEMISQTILEKFGDYTPAWGMVGTLIGLVIMMLNLSDPSAIGPSMAIALITTFYGAVFANLFFLPMAHNAETLIKENFTRRNIIIEGIMSLANEEGPRMMEDRLMVFIYHDPVYKKQLEKELGVKNGKVE